MIPMDKRILEASIQLLNRNGITKFSMRAIIKELGISLSSLYRHVPGRMALYSLICEHVCQNIKEKENAAPKEYLMDICKSLREELLKIRHSAAIFYETIPASEKHRELKPKVMKALSALGVKEAHLFSSACILINYCLFSVWDEEFYRAVSGARNPQGIIGFYQNQLSGMDYETQFLYGLEVILNGYIIPARRPVSKNYTDFAESHGAKRKIRTPHSSSA